MPNTHVPLYTANLSGLSSASFSNIPQIYTDLVLVFSGQDSATSSSGFSIGINNTFSGGLYSSTTLEGNGSSAYSSRASSQNGLGATISGGTSLPGNAIINFQNYSNTTTFKTIFTRYNASSAFTGAKADLFRSTSAITRLDFFPYSGPWATGTTISIYGVANADQGTAKATGGIITEDSQYWYHTFGASGTFTPKQALTCDYLVVAGGGSGGSGQAGGGGAGGLRSTVTATGGLGTLETPLSLLSNTSYTVTIGAGGAARTGDGNGSPGTNSVFATITSTGGGFGGGYRLSGGGTGGSGGGGNGDNSQPGGARTSSPVQGFAGGSGGNTSGGGGGAGAAGGNASGSVTGIAGSGGIGVAIPTFAAATGTGVSNHYAGGGGGGVAQGGTKSSGGSGGGGAGGERNITLATNGTVNTGGGGGGNDGGDLSGAGGSGIVIIRYAK
jgi:hypothetical protein